MRADGLSVRIVLRAVTMAITERQGAAKSDRFWLLQSSPLQRAGQWTEGIAFSGVQSAFYWSSTTVADSPDLAWFVFLVDGVTIALDKGITTLCGRSGGEQNRSFDALRLWTLWGVQGGSPLPRHIFWLRAWV